MEQIQQLADLGAQQANAGNYQQARDTYLKALDQLNNMRQQSGTNSVVFKWDLDQKMRELLAVAERIDTFIRQQTGTSAPTPKPTGQTQQILQHLGSVLLPFVRDTLITACGPEQATRFLQHCGGGLYEGVNAVALLGLLNNQWDFVFHSRLPTICRSYVTELQWFSTQWGQTLGVGEEFRFIDTAVLLVNTLPQQPPVSAEKKSALDKIHKEMLQKVYAQKMGMP
eukprot:TRINITY_DN67860_c11_g1_i1.p1 TRINITY_DN67860_c11_g1~~TRINITY_DN67860_c11_g1_i1.p1  ORF type:complete len:226 (-),score=28.03 TRINITY_DN67860_c11_g1_i1:589-1266(-)